VVAFRFRARDGTELLFREPVRSDAPRMMRFINAFVSERRSGLLIDKKVTLAGERIWLKGWLADVKQKKGVMLLVEKDGQVVGNCTASRLAWKNSHAADFGIALSKEIRGKGVGEALMKRTIELAQKRMRGLEMLHLKAIAYNDRARALYEKLGFVEVGRIPKANKEGREYFDDILMVKFL
jgi:RimJ/RimL family protein N-acetyltransferase